MTNACCVNRNESMFSRADWGISFFARNSHNATDPNKFNQVLRDMMKEIASRAANDGLVWREKFAVQEANYSPSQRIYALGQCTPDLSRNDFEKCLRNAIFQISGYCSNSLGCKVMSFSCNIRYALYKFYSSVSPTPKPASNLGPTALPFPPPSNSTNSEGHFQFLLN
ncbi:unnamed protein product [Coffea canephora]|uniref:DH200=94 genomic scaffold, scaffold_3122 n=1 Tax=Coffea canephora TaxID=49390 RepID=A0A068VKF7_COFCA|nr:unnamed protein product [Coffea canephora]